MNFKYIVCIYYYCYYYYFIFFKDNTQRAGDIIFHPFDRVVVQLSLDRSNIQHEKLRMFLVEPQVPGFSISSTGELLPMDEDIPTF